MVKCVDIDTNVMERFRMCAWLCSNRKKTTSFIAAVFQYEYTDTYIQGSYRF